MDIAVDANRSRCISYLLLSREKTMKTPKPTRKAMKKYWRNRRRYDRRNMTIPSAILIIFQKKVFAQWFSQQHIVPKSFWDASLGSPWKSEPIGQIEEPRENA